MLPISVSKVASFSCGVTRSEERGYYICYFPARQDGGVVAYVIHCDGNDTNLVQHVIGNSPADALARANGYIKRAAAQGVR